jgi:hypothetical protein
MADPLPVLQPPSIIASAAYVLTAVVFEGTPYAALLETFETWRSHFGVDNTSDKDASDVRGSLASSLTPELGVVTDPHYFDR